MPVQVREERERQEGLRNCFNLNPSGLQSVGRVADSFGEATDVRDRRLRLIAGALAIVALIFAVYRPIMPGTFVMDDARLIGADNPLVNGNLTPWTIWFQTDFTLATFGWWVERLVFGNNPAG
jgi:hypothetical protein